MGVQLNFTRIGQLVTAPLDPSVDTTTLEDGMLMTFTTTVDGAGRTCVAPTDGSGDTLAGFLRLPTNLQSSLPVIERFTIPSSSPFTVTLAAAPSADDADNIRVILVSTGASLTYDDAGAPADGAFELTGTTVTFNSAQAGLEIDVVYRKDITPAQFNARGQWSINSQGGASQFGIVELARGDCEFYTSCFNAGAVITADVALTTSTAAAGRVGIGGSPTLGTCIAPPLMLDSPGIRQAFIGVKCNI